MQGAVKPCPLSQGGITSAGTTLVSFQPTFDLFYPGGIGGLARLIARMKIIRSHRALLRVEFSFWITSHKNYYVNSRVKNEETSAFETN